MDPQLRRSSVSRAVQDQNLEIRPTSDAPTQRMVGDKSQNSPEIEVSRSVDIWNIFYFFLTQFFSREKSFWKLQKIQKIWDFISDFLRIWSKTVPKCNIPENHVMGFVHARCGIQNASMMAIFSTDDLYNISNVQFWEKNKIHIFSPLLEVFWIIPSIFYLAFTAWARKTRKISRGPI